MQDALDRVSSRMRSSQMLRLFSVGFLALLLQIPISMIGARVSERQERRDEAVAEVSSKWGSAQAIMGPALVVPFKHHRTRVNDKGEAIAYDQARTAVYLPERLHASGVLASE